MEEGWGGGMKSLSAGHKGGIVGWCGGNYTTQAPR